MKKTRALTSGRRDGVTSGISIPPLCLVVETKMAPAHISYDKICKGRPVAPGNVRVILASMRLCHLSANDRFAINLFAKLFCNLYSFELQNLSSAMIQTN